MLQLRTLNRTSFSCLSTTLSFLGQTFDVAGIYLLSIFILLIVINLVLDIGLVIAPELRRYLVGVMILLGVGSEIYYVKVLKLHIELAWIKKSIATLLLAFSIWILDIKKIVCYPESLLQGHALWHILSTLSIYFLYNYYLSEEVSTTTAIANPPS